MTIWRSRSVETQPVCSLLIEQGILEYFRVNGALTRIDIDALVIAELRVLQSQVYWYLEDQTGRFMLLPESLPEIGIIRRYLSRWRGFNYDGLLRFDMTKQNTLRLWPLQEEQVA